MFYETHLDMEIRKLKPAELYILGNILSISDSWKKLMSIVPKQENIPKFSSDHISNFIAAPVSSQKKLKPQVFETSRKKQQSHDDRMISIIEQTAHRDKRSAAQIFLDEWSTMGRKRPTLKLLLELLIKAELFRAADYVACDILKQERPERPDYGPAAPIDISDAAINQLLDKQMLPQNTFANSVLGSTSALISEINIMCPSEKSADVQAAQSYRYEELSSEELPVFLNNCK